MAPFATPETSDLAGPHAVDQLVGRNLRQLRKKRGWSQTALANEIGVSFQQLQKYERATNRVSASRLYQLALALGAPVSTFFAGVAMNGGGAPTVAAGADDFLRLCDTLPAPRRRLLLRIARDLAEAGQTS